MPVITILVKIITHGEYLGNLYSLSWKVVVCKEVLRKLFVQGTIASIMTQNLQIQCPVCDALIEVVGTECKLKARGPQTAMELKLKELSIALESQKKLSDEMKRKLDQTSVSVQLQGQAQEDVIVDWLIKQFPFDIITPVTKGQRGADCLQQVFNSEKQLCGSIYYESKRTKEFNDQWPEKFKLDIKEKNADIGILVSQTMPTSFKNAGILRGVWISPMSEWKTLAMALRESMIQMHQQKQHQVNNGTKMEYLYGYLTSPQFQMHIEEIVQGFSQLKNDLEAEKRAMQKIWKQREKQIEKVLTHTVDMYGSIKGIAGNAIGEVKSLEL